MMEKDKGIWVKFIQSIPNKNTWTPTGLNINTHTLKGYCNETCSGLIFHIPSLGLIPQSPHCVKAVARPLSGACHLLTEQCEAHLHTGLLVIAKFHPTHHSVALKIYKPTKQI